MTTDAPPPPQAPAAKPKTSGLAIASLVLGILGPCTLGLASLAGFVLGVVSLTKIKRGAGQLGGRGLAIAGVVLGAIGIVITPLLLMAALLPAVFSALKQANAASSANCVSQLCKVNHMYANRHNGAFLPSDTWPEVVKSMGIADTTLRNLADPSAGRGYAMNAGLAGKTRDDVRQPSLTVLFFECIPGAPPAGGPELLPPEPRFGTGYIIGFCDGHVETVAMEKRAALIWDLERPPKE